MYLRSLHDLRFQSYVINNITLTENGFGYLKIEQDILDEYGVDGKLDCKFLRYYSFLKFH